MLKLNHQAMWGADICNVLFRRFLIILDELLAFGRKVVFPRAMPLRFLFCPGITIPNSPMRPVGNSVRATFGDNLAIANGTGPLPPA